MVSSDEEGREEVEAHFLSCVPCSFLDLEFVLGILELCLDTKKSIEMRLWGWESVREMDEPAEREVDRRSSFETGRKERGQLELNGRLGDLLTCSSSRLYL
jgi:hypothetical protein